LVSADALATRYLAAKPEIHIIVNYVLVFLASWRLNVARDIDSTVVKQKACVVPWCAALTNSRSAKSGNSGTLCVVSGDPPFYTLFFSVNWRPNLSKCHSEKFLSLWQSSGQTAEWTVL